MGKGIAAAAGAVEEPPRCSPKASRCCRILEYYKPFFGSDDARIRAGAAPSVALDSSSKMTCDQNDSDVDGHSVEQF